MLLCTRMNAAKIRPGLVLLFTKPAFSSQREKVNGVYDAAIRRGWQIQVVETRPTAALMREYIRLWHPIGCLLDPTTIDGPFAPSTFANLPTVLLGRDAERRRQVFDCSHQKTDDPPKIAVEELSALGMHDFAFVGDSARPYWSVERGKLFKANMPRGAFFSEYGGPNPETAKGRHELARWINALPHPCGCFLAADHIGQSFYAAASEAGRIIGEDLLVVSVDNDERLCLSLSPKLSSIALDFFQAGANAVKLLAERISNPHRALSAITYQPLGLIRRASSNPVFTDRRVTRGMAFITEHGCEAVSLNDVAAAMGCGRRLAMILFRKHTGMSVVDAVHEVRMEKVFLLLRNKMVQIDAIPYQCGYAASPAYLKTYFKRVTGLTMREWRRRNVAD